MEYVLKKLNPTITVDKVAHTHFFDFSKSYFTKPESHPFYELLFVSSGSLEVTSDELTTTIGKNQLVIHSPNSMHSLSCQDDTSTTVVIIGFTCDGVDLSSFAKRPVTLSPSSVKMVADIIKEGRNVFLPPYDVPVYDMRKRPSILFGSEQMLRVMLELFLIKIIREYRIYSSDFGDTDGSSTLAIDEVISYLRDNYKEKITIDELSFLFGTNRSTLCKEFKNATGSTLTSFVMQKRINEAINRVVTTDMSFTEIAEELNFDSIHYFTRFFKKMTGLAPKEYRKTHAKRKEK